MSYLDCNNNQKTNRIKLNKNCNLPTNSRMHSNMPSAVKTLAYKLRLANYSLAPALNLTANTTNGKKATTTPNNPST